ncbi:MAG: tRNA uridine-5-carboxymethylaminomethyl(34) synthesis GTPase MnmE [Firmicutes bacterium]|nr:tRNA uridine-5-carboxymethylaminomethyl(34) synthesis GTPase MnmE [Bacillota bacterium]
MRQEAIAAIATPVAEGGIGVIRISGDNAIEILKEVFFPVRKHIENPKFSDMARMNVSKDREIMNIAAEKRNNLEKDNTVYDESDISFALELEMSPDFQKGMLIGESSPIKPGKAEDLKEIDDKRLHLPTSISEKIGLPIENRRMSYGFVKDPEDGQVIDEVLAVAMEAPYTYTRENVAEIYCHGSVVALRKTLKAILKCGARIAEPGEFTKRAFLNGRLDLSQAEALIDVIKAKTDTGFKAAMSQMQGKLSQKIKEIRNELMNILVDISVNIDYPEEDIEHLNERIISEQLNGTNTRIEKLIQTVSTGKIIKDGLKIAIIGKPNVGKSSLMNILLREERAIVTAIPGTTRDTIEETASIKGIKVILTDTAGIRETEDEIEKLGIERSKVTANNADVVMFVIDGSEALSPEDFEIAEAIKENEVIAIINKRDKKAAVKTEEIKKLLPAAYIVEASMQLEEGIDNIENLLEKFVYSGERDITKDDVMITNTRHEGILKRAYDLISNAVSLIKNREVLDIVEIDVKEAYELLGEITGETVTDDIINEIFSRFCLGK